MARDGQADWLFYDINSIPDEARTAWDSLNSRFANNNPALDFRFVELLVRVFGDGSERVAFCRKGSEYLGGAVLCPKTAMTWELFVPSQACLSPFVMADEVDAPELMSRLVRKLPGVCAMLRCQRIDPACQPYDELVTAKLADAVLYGTTYTIDLEMSFDEYWKARSKGLRYKMRKYARMVAAAGMQATLSIISDPDRLSDAVFAHGSLESKGWKGAEGTAICKDNLQGAFYSELMQAFAMDEDAFAAQLHFDDTLVASLLSIGLQSNLVVLKIAYDEDYARFGPGRLADFYFIEKLCGNGKYKEAEMYTQASPSDLSWATDSREWYDIDLCRNRAIYEGLNGAKWLKSLARRPFAAGTSNE